jgi:hypothetical protein
MEWWQKHVPWLNSSNEIFSLPVMYFFAPQHLAGGIAFLLALFLWRNIRAHEYLRAGALGVLMAFTFGTSPFVFLGMAVGALLWVFEYRRALWRKRSLLVALAFWIPFTLGFARQMTLTMSGAGRIVANGFRVPLIENLLHAETASLGLLDKALTIAGLPVVMFWILLIDIGLPLVIYGVWVFQRSWRHRSIWNRLAVVYPIVMFLMTVFLTDQNGGGNFSRRGLIPMQIVIALAAAMAWKNWEWPRTGWRDPRTRSWFTGQTLRVFLCGYILLAFAAAQSVSWLVWEQDAGQTALGCALRVKKPALALGFGIASCPGMPEEFAYVSWLNRQTPASALIVEEKIPSVEDRRLLLLERMRYVDPIDAQRVYDFRIEWEITPPDDLARLGKITAGKDVLAAAMQSAYVRQNRPPVYFVARNGARPELGEPVYTDKFVTIYKVE